MQIMPGTWSELRSRCHLGVDPYDPHDNILVGTAYIRELHDHYGVPGFLPAYPAGTGRYERPLAAGRAVPEEAHAYVSALCPVVLAKPDDGKLLAVASSFACD